MVKRISLLPFAISLMACAAAHAQGRVINTFPYNQVFAWVGAGTTGFPATNVDGGEFTADAGTGTTWTTSIAGHGLNNNGGAGGAIRLQPTVGNGPAGFVWYGDFSGNCPDSLAIDWLKVTNSTLGSRTNELRVATNGGAGATFTDLPPANIAGGTWPSFDNQATAQSGTLRVRLPASFNGSADARIRIYAVNISGSGNLPRVVVDNLAVTVLGRPMAGRVDSAGNAAITSLTLFVTPGTDADSILVLRRTGAPPTAMPADGVRYSVGQGLNATDTIVFAGSGGTRSIPFSHLQPGTTYYFAMYGLRTCNGRYSLTPATGSGSTRPCTGAAAAIANVTTIGRAQDSLVLGFTAGAQTDSVLVLRRSGLAPDSRPEDNVRYVAGQGLNATDTVIYSGAPVSSIVARGLRADSLYVFAFYGMQSCNGAYSVDVMLDTVRTYCLGTVAGVTGVTGRYVTATAAGLAVAGASDATGFMVFSNGPDTLRPAPVSGVPYSVGAVVGDDTVRYIGTDRRPVVTGLHPNTLYRFTVFGVRICNYAYSAVSDTISVHTIDACSPAAPVPVDSFVVRANVRDTLVLRWREDDRATGYLIVARTDSTPSRVPLDGCYYLPGDSLGAGCAIIAKTERTIAVIQGLPANTAYFLRAYAYRECDLLYSPSASAVLAVATPGTPLSQRFAIRAGFRDTIRFAGSVTAFSSPVQADGSLQITRTSGPLSGRGIPMLRSGRTPINVLSTDRWWSYRATGLGRITFGLAFDASGLPGLRDAGDLEIVFRSAPGFPWEDFITTGREVSASGAYLRADTQHVFRSEYAIGGNTTFNTLPVRLLSFEGYAGERGNVLHWRTAAELENTGFRLYRMVAGVDSALTLIADYRSDTCLRGAGTTNIVQSYDYVDGTTGLPAECICRYRLDEVALDGSSRELGSLGITRDAEPVVRTSGLSIAPNPVAGNLLNLRCTVVGSGPATISLVNVFGETVWELMREPDATPGVHALCVSLPSLPNGNYFCRMESPAGACTVLLVIMR
ncbi:MAG TPA: hypothetical protein VHI13_12975 [Candidatus Kapabacteria bacterium]|nr:hypothetical protein [Candidatus Kapabacteria bacterium]